MLMATAAGTEKYFERLAKKSIPKTSVRTLGQTGFRVGSIGFGGYRIHHNSIEHARALRYALLNGFNLIDTSSNYTDGGSEMLTGNVLQEMFDRGELHRDEVVLVSKVGYVQGQNLQRARQNERNGQPFPDMVKYMEECWHCIHPEFLEDQLSRSLERLNQPFLDLYLLHNPEYFLSHAKKNSRGNLDEIRHEYYRRIKLAFEWMESKVSEGKIKAYGISSNTFVVPAGDAEFTSFEKTLEIARAIRTDHFYRAVQFPLNLFETGALLEKNQQSGTRTLLELAMDRHMATLTNRPLNATLSGRMVRLASFREKDATVLTEQFATRWRTLQQLEERFRREFLARIGQRFPDIPRENFQKVFSMAESLQDALHLFQSWEHWDHVRQNIIIPQSFSTLNYLRDKMSRDEEWTVWAGKYAEALMELLDAIDLYFENQAQQRSQKLAAFLEEAEPLLTGSPTLSQKALRVVSSLPGVDCVLLGMRRVPYVEDAFAALQQEPVPSAERILMKLAELDRSKLLGL